MATKTKKAVPNPAAGAVSLKVLAARDEVAGVARGVTTFKVDPRIIVIDWSKNVRPMNRAHIATLKQARLDGAVFPAFVVSVDDGVIEIIEGYHRLTEIIEDIEAGAEIDTVQCVEFKGPASERRALKVGSGMGLALTPLQLGEQYKLLNTADGWSIAKIAARFGGKSEQHVRDMIQLSEVERDVKDQIESGKIAPATALKVVKSEGKGAGKVIADAVATAAAAGKKMVKPKDLKPKVKPGITPEHIDASVTKHIENVKERAAMAKTHLAAMLDSPNLDEVTKDAVKTVMAKIKTKTSLNDAINTQAGGDRTPTVTGNTVSSADRTDIVKAWLSNYGPHPDKEMRDAASMLLRAMSGIGLPAPGLTMHEAVDMEMKSAGSVMAETLVPEFADKITYLRSTGAV